MFTHLRQFLRKNIRSLKLGLSSSSQVAILVFLFFLLSTTIIVWQLEQSRLMTERSRISSVADEYGNEIQSNMERTLSVTYALSALVQEYQGMIPNFKSVAQDLLELYPGAYALALLPDGVVNEIITLENNEVTIDYNQLKDFNQTQKVISAKNKEELILTVPSNLIKNFSGTIGYLPIFLENNQGKKEFWGFTTVTIRFPEVLKDINLQQLEAQGFAYQLWLTHSGTNQRQILAASSTATIDNPVEQVLEIYNTNLTLSLTPVAGWNHQLRLCLKFMIGLSLSFILAALVKFFLDSKFYALELERIAYFDPLSGLPNRRLLLYRLEQIIASTQRGGKNVAICYLDLDNFKAINNRLGNKIGDYILVRIAKRLQKFLRVEDVIARINGDEFVIVLQNLSHIEEVELILERIIEAVTTPITLDSKIILVSTSIGITIYPQDNHNIETLLCHANQAMSYSKQNNKGSYTIFSDLKKTVVQSTSKHF